MVFLIAFRASPSEAPPITPPRTNNVNPTGSGGRNDATAPTIAPPTPNPAAPNKTNRMIPVCFIFLFPLELLCSSYVVLLFGERENFQ